MPHSYVLFHAAAIPSFDSARFADPERGVPKARQVCMFSGAEARDLLRRRIAEVMQLLSPLCLSRKLVCCHCYVIIAAIHAVTCTRIQAPEARPQVSPNFSQINRKKPLFVA